MEEKKLSSLNPSQFMEKSGWDFSKSWNGKVDISAWMRASISRGGRLYLFLEYKDQQGKHAVPIDRCMTPTPDSILLNGRLNLSGRGRIENLTITLRYAGCDSSSIVLEELTVKPLIKKRVVKPMRQAV